MWQRAVVLGGLLGAGAAGAIPQVGRAIPAFSANDLLGTNHTHRELRGGWTIGLVMTDKDAGDDLHEWFVRLAPRLPANTRQVSLIAIDIVAIVPDAVVMPQVRSLTPRDAWSTVWFSRDGSLARQLGLPSSETTWVLVIDPAGRVAQTLHASATEQDILRVLAAIR